jgi:hypothetical protein
MTVVSFPKTGLVRLSQVLAPIGPIPVSKSTWWQGAYYTTVGWFRGPGHDLQTDSYR